MFNKKQEAESMGEKKKTVLIYLLGKSQNMAESQDSKFSKYHKFVIGLRRCNPKYKTPLNKKIFFQIAYITIITLCL